MNTYKVNWSRDDYGYILIKANSKEEAQELFESGEFKDDDLELKGGNMVFNDITKID